ncbi:hypothetical protein B0T26DRAFT_791819 [Lasiosphaeria miniovina]|uniref:Uncharacterized protein n=1 Tax=Lasiosphaeria miniovina TaxID=1954250 RepID=A0AA40DGZ0_9PEZI|nr:uncharacterized protein B0T26DRAFT_791819 [Lasiosphaeria miniovina]KAK0703129.1 hypothetical protein B0T26DRAFT_791819 [Lasiosphaeria miniovina]
MAKVKVGGVDQGLDRTVVFYRCASAVQDVVQNWCMGGNDSASRVLAAPKQNREILGDFGNDSVWNLFNQSAIARFHGDARFAVEVLRPMDCTVEQTDFSTTVSWTFTYICKDSWEEACWQVTLQSVPPASETCWPALKLQEAGGIKMGKINQHEAKDVEYIDFNSCVTCLHKSSSTRRGRSN